MMPCISVIMPVFNTKAEYLHQAVASLIAQTFEDWELLIVDDGSTKTELFECFTEISSLDPRVHIVHHSENRGISQARNTALEHARGEYIAFFDSDDICKSDRFAVQLAYFKAHPECGCLASLVQVIGDDCQHGEMFHSFETSDEIEFFLRFIGSSFCTSTVMVRRSLLDALNLRFDPEYKVAEDYDFWCRMLGKTKFYVLKERLVSYRFHFDNTTHLKHREMRDFTIKIWAKNLHQATSCRVSVDLCEMYYSGRPQTMMQLRRILIIISKLIESLKEQYPQEQHDQIKAMVTSKIRALFYHCKGFKKQLCLFKSPLAKELRLPLLWRVYCLITRSISL